MTGPTEAQCWLKRWVPYAFGKHSLVLVPLRFIPIHPALPPSAQGEPVASFASATGNLSEWLA